MIIQKILLIEPDAVLRTYLSDQLSTRGYDVAVAPTVREGILTGIVVRPQLIFFNRRLDDQGEELREGMNEVVWLAPIPAISYDDPPTGSDEGHRIQRGLLFDSLFSEITLQEGMQEHSESGASSEDSSLAEVLEAMAEGRKSCRLEISGDRGSGEIFLDRGNLCGARSGTRMGVEALEALLDMENIQLKFSRMPTPPRQIDPPLSVARLLEERRGDRVRSRSETPSDRTQLASHERSCLERLVSLGFLTRRTRDG